MRRHTLRIVILCLLGLAAVVFLYYIRSLLIPFGIAVLMAYIIYPLIRSLEAREIKRSWAIFTVYAAGLLFISILMVLFVPALLDEAKTFGKILPVYVDTWGDLQEYADQLLMRTNLPPEALQVWKETAAGIRRGALESLRGFARTLVGSISLLPVLSFLPPEHRNDLLFLMREGDLIFSRFLRGRLLVSMIVGLLTGAGAAFAGMPFAILIGLVTAIADLIPFFGPVLAAIPVVGFALAISRWKGLAMLVIFLLVQQLEASFLTPRLLGERVGLHPLAIVLVLFVGGYLAGPLGLIFAVPAAGLLRVLVHYLWEKIVNFEK